MTRSPTSTSRGEDGDRFVSADRRRSAVADRLRELRRVRGLTQAQLAEGVGITQKMVSHYEV
ncbi:MAG: helix-turn-helix domain-containing protein, partial [Thermoplasmata archaeon]